MVRATVGMTGTPDPRSEFLFARRRGWRRITAVGIAALVVASCATTAHNGSRKSTAAGDSRAGLPPDVVQGGNQTGGSGSADAGGGSTPGGGGQGSAAAPGAASSGGGTQGGGAVVLPPPSKPTGGSVLIGIETFAGFQQAGQGFGSKGGLENQVAESQPNAQFIVDFINTHGGLGGRKLVPVYHDTNIDSNSTFDADAQATCAAWTEDNHVFLGLSPEGFDYDTLMSCMAAKNAVLVRNSLNVYDQHYADQYPQLFFSPDELFGNRYQALIDSLVRIQFFDPKSRIGIIRSDSAAEARTAQVLRAAAGAHGLKVVDEVAVSPDTSTPDVGSVLASFSSIVLRFKNENIDHVLFTEGPVFPLGFMTNAESQHYRPKYGLTVQENLSFLQSNAPSAQLQNAAGMTWADVPNYPLDNSGDKLCRAIHPGVNPYCALLLFVKAAFDKGGGPTPSSFAAGVQSLGTTFVSPAALTASFQPHAYQDGEGAVRPFAWSQACSCFNYAGGPTPVAK